MAVGNLADPTLYRTYVSVFSRDSVRLAIIIAALNIIYILAGDTQNAYLNAPTKEKVFFNAGDEWKYDQGKVIIIVRSLYGLNSSALIWSNHLYEILSYHFVSQ